jgi:hypothetical protein
MGAAKTFREWWNAQGPIDYKMDRRSAEIAWNAAQNAMEIAPSASANKQMVAALWRALSDKDVNTRDNSKGVWLPLTKKRLNAAYTKVFGL